jgi:hypothetical protein
VTHLDWLILDATADDFESIVQIAPNVLSDLPQTPRVEIARHIIELLRGGFLQQLERGEISLEDFASVPERLQPPFWFGMTPRGADAWEHSATEFGSEPPDWSRAYSCSFHFAASRGHCDGVSREVCLSAIRSSRDHAAVREETFQFESIDSFSAKYYKRIEGGVRVSFDLIKP